MKVEGFCVLPENWADSVYWTMDALSNLYEYGTLTDEDGQTYRYLYWEVIPSSLKFSPLPTKT